MGESQVSVTGAGGQPNTVVPAPADIVSEARLRLVRASAKEDLDAIRPIVLAYHRESRYAHLPFSETKFVHFFSRATSSPQDTLAVYAQFGRSTVGLLHAGAGDYYLGEGGRMVTVYALYVPKVMRETSLGGRVAIKLFRTLTDWAHAQEAGEIHVHSTSGILPLRTERLLLKLGFHPYGGNYASVVYPGI